MIIRTVRYYIFYSQDERILVISGEKTARPLLADIPFVKNVDSLYETPYLWKYYEEEITNGRRLKSTMLHPHWEFYESGMKPPVLKTGNTVSPMIETRWEQGYPYNSACPDGTWVGCIPLAQAQVIVYWARITPGYKGWGGKGEYHQVRCYFIALDMKMMIGSTC
ncbi:MAG: hypothetical protein HN686_12085 [Bacteroidetes bacterium]|nr:hypothetical protein [Bacteroidota bacterium]